MSETSTQQQSSDNNGSAPPIKYEYEILSEDYTNFDLSFKLIVIGDSGVGKSCLTNNAIKNVFDEAYNATVGFEFFTFNVKMCEKVIKLQIWDTCGQELYRSLITNFYRNSSLAIIVYAINSKASFESIDMWLKELRTHSNLDAKVFLIANKIDLDKDRKISKEEGEKFKEVNKLDYFMEASAKTGVNAQNIFVQAAKMLYEDYLKYKTDDETVESDQSLKTMELSSKKIDSKKPKTGGCC